MYSAARKGRRILLTYITLILLASASVTTFYLLTIGPGRIAAQVGRFALTAGLCAWLYGGSTTARWIMITVLTFGGTLAVGLSIPTQPPHRPIGITLGILYLTFAMTLLWSSRVTAFLDYQRNLSNR